MLAEPAYPAAMSPRVLLSAALLFLLGCPTEPADPPVDDGVDTLAWAVDLPGPFQVGHTALVAQYTLPATGELRQIPVSVWYPTEDTEGAPAEHYAGIVGEAFEGATPAAPVHDGGYPVLAYSHGHVMYPAASKFLMNHVASHGWVAIAPAHEGNTLITAGPNSPRPVHMWVDRSHDVSAALDLLAEGRVALAGRANLERVVMSGHSFGGHTTWASAGGAFDVATIEARCEDPAFVDGSCTELALDAFEAGGADDRFLGAIAMDGSGSTDWFGAAGLGAIQIPMMQMYTDSDPGRITPPERAPGVDLRDVMITGACHGTFSVATGCALPADEGYHLVQSYAFAFARHVALGDDTERTMALLTGDELLSDRITVDAHE